MKQWLVVLLLITVFYISGCWKSEKLNINNKNQNYTKVTAPHNSNEKSDNLPMQDINDISEFSIIINDKKVSLMDGDHEVNLEELFGKPIQEEIRKLGVGSDTYEGSYIKEIKFPGIELELFSPKDNGKNFYILSMEVRDSKVQTKRGLKVGESLEELNKIYPEIEPILDDRKDINNRGYKIEEGAYNYIIFEVKQGVVISIRIYHEFA